jgi:hypothetical protein
MTEYRFCRICNHDCVSLDHTPIECYTIFHHEKPAAPAAAHHRIPKDIVHWIE